MATIASRLTNTGTLLVNGAFDEVTYNTSAPTITNLFYSSQDFSSNTLWQRASSITVSNTSATLAPDGTTTAQLVTVGGAGIYPYIRSLRNGGSAAVVPCTPGTTYTVSVYMKYINQQYVNIVNEDAWTGSMSTRFDILNGIKTAPSGNVAATTITNVGNGWWRLSATYVPVPAGITYWNPQPIRIGSFNATNYSGSQVYVWGAQLEASASPSAYQGIAAANTLVPPTFATKTAPNTVYTTGQFDEVTYTSGFAKRETQTGNLYVTGGFDEFTGAPVVDSSLLWWTDAAQTASYTGSGTTVRNLANTTQTGAFYGNVSYSSANGGNFVFDNYLDTTNSISAGNLTYPTSVNDPWTMEAWMYVPSSATWSINNNVGPLYIRGSYAGAHGLVRMQANNSVAVWLRGNTTALAYRTGTITRDRWNQVVGVWTGGTGGNLQCYVNGTLTQASTTTQDDPLDTTANYFIGAQNTGLSNNTGAVFMGNVSSTKLYTRALSADEVAQNFNALRRRYNI